MTEKIGFVFMLFFVISLLIFRVLESKFIPTNKMNLVIRMSGKEIASKRSWKIVFTICSDTGNMFIAYYYNM